ncbi:hypothetical protein [Geodermatophilus sp. CPCC 205506]|uniref:hypothetical protein n=1 Tax=Geodermatophilus sp. CPCC 205506 TaxID=2936596 RepID=UPI003EED8C4F
MSVTSEPRSAAFTQHSPDVEVYSDGAWWPGAILGWRHDQRGACEVSVRAVVAGRERESWVDLGDLRLPEPELPGAAGAEPATADPAPATTLLRLPLGATPMVTVDAAAARRQLVADVLTSPEFPAVEPGAPRRRHGGDVTAEFPAIRGGLLAGRHRAPSPAGRHRAADDDVASPAAVAPRPRPDADCLTRPMRLTDRVSRPRLPRPGAARP